MRSEIDSYKFLIMHHLLMMANRLQKMDGDACDWSARPAAPSARQVSAHALAWLICDRYHIVEPDALKHPPVPESPGEIAALADAMRAEWSQWEAMLDNLTVESLTEERWQLNYQEGEPLSVRWFIDHSIQNLIYKSGQLATNYFALGFDGEAPYSAPMPRLFYAQIHEAAARDAS